MTGNPNQKVKLLYLMKILLEKSDENHFLSTAQLLEELRQYGIEAERKSIYGDIQALRIFGLDIELVPGRNGGYYIADRTFQLAELKLLVDSVQACKFISERKTRSLIHKLESLTSQYQAKSLHRQVYVQNRIKTMNESVYYNVDAIHNAINQDRQIRFRYFDYTVEKLKQYRRNGEYYVVSPLALLWEDEKYYLIGYDEQAGYNKHYRVDKMSGIELLSVERVGTKTFCCEELSLYSRKVFSMFGGEEEQVTMAFHNKLAGVVLDRFGKDTQLFPEEDGYFQITVRLQLSPQFYGWVFSLGSEVRILSPDYVRMAFQEMARRATEIG